MEKQFTTPVSMKVTEQQFKNDLETPLKEMGYSIEDIESFLEFNTIATNYASKSDSVSNVDYHARDDRNRYFVDHYNPKLFLALAGMTNSPNGNVGEWWKCVDNNQSIDFTTNKLYKQIKKSMTTQFSVLDDSEEPNGFFGNSKNHFTKATKEEIIAFFSETETEPEQELIGYRFRNDEFNRMLIKYFNEGNYYPLRENDIHLKDECDGVDKLKELGILETFCEPVYAQKETPISYEEAIEKLNENSKVKYTKKA